jgi:hypothetical protein
MRRSNSGAIKGIELTTEQKLLLVGCGILNKEIRFLIEKNDWPVETVFLDSALHTDFGKLGHCLKSALAAHRNRDTIVFYGCCHPRMEPMLAEARTFRIEGQNCIEALLGRDVFDAQLANGAFFLLEDWVQKWDRILKQSFGTTDVEIIRDIFRGDRKYLLCIKTPCSQDFTAEAERAAQLVNLPICWMNATLDHLESVLRAAVTRKLAVPQ